MARRKSEDNFLEVLYEILLIVPVWVGPPLAAAFYLGLRFAWPLFFSNDKEQPWNAFAAIGPGIAPYVGVGVLVSQFHLMSHAVFKALLFLTAGVIIHELGGMRDMRNYGGLRKEMPITFYTCLFGVFALSGIAPFNGFWSKDLIFKTALETGHFWAFIILYITAIITIAYSFRALFLTFFGEKSEYAKKFHIHEPKIMIIPLIILAAFTVLTGFFEHQFAEFMGIHTHSDGIGGIDPVILGLSVVAWIIGITPAYYVYIKRKPSPEIFGRGVWGTIQKMLFECYYIDKFYYLVFVDKLTAGIQKFRKTHPGILNFNVCGIIGGFLVMLLLILLLVA